MLANEVARRSDYFFRLWLESDCEDVWSFKYTIEDVQAYVEDLEIIEWLLEQPLESDSFSKGQYVRTLRPVISG